MTSSWYAPKASSTSTSSTVHVGPEQAADRPNKRKRTEGVAASIEDGRYTTITHRESIAKSGGLAPEEAKEDDVNHAESSTSGEHDVFVDVNDYEIIDHSGSTSKLQGEDPASAQQTIGAGHSGNNEIHIPDPPGVESPIPQDAGLLQSQTAQDALQKALGAWYTAGYATALYHARTGQIPL